MIDLNKNQIVDPPVECWVRDNDRSQWIRQELFVIDHRFTGYGFITANDSWKQCSLTDPTIPTKKIKKWLTVEDVPVELWGRALVRSRRHKPFEADILSPSCIANANGTIDRDSYVYLPLGQPLTSEWLPFESEE